MNKITKKLCNRRKASFLVSFDNIPNIVVLLILAGITIMMIVSDDGIIKYAQKAADSANQAQKDTLEGLSNISNQLSNPFENDNQNTGSQGGEIDYSERGPFKPPIIASNRDFIGREVNYTVADSSIQKKLDANSNGWFVLYSGPAFSVSKEEEIYIMLKKGIDSTNAPRVVDSSGHQTNLRTKFQRFI